MWTCQLMMIKSLLYHSTQQISNSINLSTILMVVMSVMLIIHSILFTQDGLLKLMDCSLMLWTNLYWKPVHLVLNQIILLLFQILSKMVLSLIPVKSHTLHLLSKIIKSSNIISDQELQENLVSIMPLNYLVELTTVQIMIIFTLLLFRMTNSKQ